MNEATETQRIDAPGMQAEELPSLGDFFEEPTGGALKPGWYRGEIVAGYKTARGTEFRTEDAAQANGRRMFRLCFNLQDKGQTRTINQAFFYDPQYFTAEGLKRIKALRVQFQGVKSWPGHGNEQNANITLVHLAQLEKAVGFQLKLHPTGGFIAPPYVGQKLDVRVGIDKKNEEYRVVTAFAVAGTKAS